MKTQRFFKFRISFISSSYFLKQTEFVVPTDGLVSDLKKRILDAILPNNKEDIELIYNNKKMYDNLELICYFQQPSLIYNVYVFRKTWSKFMIQFLKYFF